jgi:hypothetical protein
LQHPCKKSLRQDVYFLFVHLLYFKVK